MAETIENLTQIVTALAKKVETVRSAEIEDAVKAEKKLDILTGELKDIQQSLKQLDKRVTELEKAKKK